ncbi:MAG: acyl-CoA carboxylase subunit beta [candidate division Zixibacteria bacterium]|nr:acyl-CoA carboxylase subunit beta [candidate division Zixibacteria bacterium]
MADSKIELLLKKREKLLKGGGDKAIEKQHKLGKLTARERLDLLFEENSFRETQLFIKNRCTHFGIQGKDFPGEGVVTGHGIVDGRPVYAASQDFTVAGGSVGEATAQKIAEVMNAALKTGDPFVMINDSGGARIQEGVDSLTGYGHIFYRNVLLSGVVPQISIIAGPCAGGAAYSPALTDFIVQVRHEGQLYITGPLVIKQVTGEDISAEQLGGVESHAHYSGVVHFIAENDEDAINITKRLLSFLPSNNTEDPPYYPEMHDDEILPNETMNGIVPEDSREPYDIHEVISGVVDQRDFLEIQEHFAPNIIVGFGRLTGRTIGVIANQPLHKAGVLDIDSSDKASRFIRFCNAFNIPVVTFVDVPGFMPGVKQEYGGIIRHGAKMLFAYASATVPKLTVVVRKAYGGAFLAMCDKSMGADTLCAWPSAEIAVMGAEGAVNVLYRKEISEAGDADAERTRRLDEYKDTFANPYFAASHGMVDDIIEPADTRAYLAAALEVLRAKRELRPQKKHGLIPL